jgi:hypothetical protein
VEVSFYLLFLAMHGLMLRKDGVAEPIASLTAISGQRFIKRVGNWLVLCGNQPATTREEQAVIDDFIQKMLNQEVACDHFPVYCYRGSTTLHLQ